MAFYKKKKLNGKWYLRSVTVGKPVTTDEIAQRLSLISTVSPGDTYAVLVGLGEILGEYMSQGRSVHLKGVGTFFYSCQSSKNGVDTPEEVGPELISSVKIRFIPEYRRKSNNEVGGRKLVKGNTDWVDIEKISAK